MKVYELMNELANLPSGQDVEIGLCITIQELMTGDMIEKELYSLRLKISEVEADGVIYTEVP